MNERSRIARNAATSYAARGVLVASTLALTPYLFRALGPSGFGAWSIMFALATIFSLLEMGFSDGLVRFVARHHAAGERDRVDEVVGTGVSLMAAFGLVAFGVAVVAALTLDGLAEPADRDDFRSGMIVLGAAMLIRFPCFAYGAALRGYQRYDLFNAALIVSTVAFVAGAVLAVELGKGVLGVAVAQAVALAGAALLFAFQLKAVEPSLSLLPRVGRRGARRSLVGFSSLTLVAEAFNFIGQRLDVVIIGALRSSAAAGPYAAAVKLQSGVQSLTLPFVDLLMPMASDLWARRRNDELLRRVSLATRVAMQLTLPLALALSLFAADVVDVWLGPTAPESTATIVALLMAVQVVGLSAAPARKVLVGVGRVRLVALLSLIEGVASVVLTFVLVAAYGAVGAAIATLVSVAVVAPLKFPLLTRTLGFPTLPFVREGVLVPVAATAPSLAGMAAVWFLLEPGAIRLALGLVVGFVLWAAVGAFQLGGDRLRSLRQTIRIRPPGEDPALTAPLPPEGAGVTPR